MLDNNYLTIKCYWAKYVLAELVYPSKWFVWALHFSHEHKFYFHMKCFQIHQGRRGQVEQFLGQKNGDDELTLELLFIIETEEEAAVVVSLIGT